MTPWKSEAIKKQLEEETGNLMRWEADEEVANKELDAKLKQIAEVKASFWLRIAFTKSMKSRGPRR